MSYNRREFIVESGLFAGSMTLGLKGPANNYSRGEADRLVLLGTQGGPFIRGYKPGPAASLILYKGIPMIVDTGYGTTFKVIEAGLSLSSLKYIFITHHHSDHNLDLGPLLYNAWIAGLPGPVDVYAPPGLKHLLDSWWECNRYDIETRIKDEGRPDIRKLVMAHEFSEGSIMSIDDIEITALRNIHPPVYESYAFKFRLGAKSIVFSGDTTYCPSLIGFAAGADYLVHEVMYGPAIDELAKRRPNAVKLKESILSHHTLAEDVGRIATQAGVKNLILNHFVPPDDKTLTDETWRNAVGREFKGKIYVGKDMMEFPL